ncbi:MAG: hypothetical protein MJZ81_02750 [Bacteroidales bacterium]|nr:hypothetical protein [Bacteroidales bacterium]
MKLKSLIITLLCCLTMTVATAQKTTVIEFNREDLSTQMLEYLNKATSDKEKQSDNAKVMRGFTSAYGQMDAALQDRMVGICNTLAKLKVRQLPDVYNFLSTTSTFWSQQPNSKNFEQWIASIEFIQKRNKKIKDFTDFIEFTDEFLKDRSLGKSRSCTWQTQANTAFTLEQKGKEIIISFSKPFEMYYSSDKDNGTIYGTTGKYYYFDQKWVGQGGRLNWDRTGIPSTACWAVLNRYEAVTKFPKFTADSVMFTNKNYFSSPIMGRVEEALSAKMEPEKYSYPKFRSYQKDFQLKELVKGVDYSGSFMMNGSKFITSDPQNPSTMIFYRNGKKFITVQSVKFTITPSKMASENAMVKIFLDEDSIYNNGITVRYSVSDKQVTLVNNSKRNYYSPYNNTYHNLDMYCEQIVWRMDKDKLDFSMLGQSGDQTFSTFESSNYYSAAKFRQLQGIDEVSPAVRMYKYMKMRGMTYDFFIDEFAQAIHMDIMQAKAMVHTLASAGLVSFNESEGKVYVKDKLVDYNQAHAKSNEFDYDAINFESSSKGTNASIDLSSNGLRMHGVKQFSVSDSQQVIIYPKGGELLVKKNRDIEFSGRINAGRFIYYVTNAQFLYDAFRLELPTVDSMFFYVTMFNNPEKERLVRTPLYSLTGNIQIDKPDNHCGLKKNKDYPIFTSEKDSYVYYDKKDIFKGTYKRDRFYYTIHPFVVKNMVDFATDSLSFNGVLTSAGIFPDIVEPLKVQPDYSLGFVRETPKGGLPAYGGKGTYNQTLDLSYRGFLGRGQVEYLSATIKSKDIVFMPDSMKSVSDTFFVKENATFPAMANGRCNQHWYPYEDSMRVEQRQPGSKFIMYRGDAKLGGMVTLRPAGATAKGTFYINEGTIASQRFTLNPRQMDANVSTFILNSTIYTDVVAFKANNMKSHVDYDKKIGEFTAPRIERTELPLLKYLAYVDKFSWAMDKQRLDLLDSHSESDQGMGALALKERVERGSMPGARFVSTDPQRDSLEWNSVQPTYYYNVAELTANGVFMVNTADAAVAPGGDTLHIRQGGAMNLMNKAQILASRDNKYHLIYDADVMVNGRYKYTGKGYIDYVDENEKKQKIFLSEIKSNSAQTTVGEGFITDSANFTLNEALGFAGKVRVSGDKQFYFFDGGVRLLHSCSPAEMLGLLAYKGYTDPSNIRVAVPEVPTDWKGNRITASILIDRTSLLGPRGAFLTNERAADNELMGASGYLYYDKGSRTYTIASDKKLDDMDNIVERYLSLNAETCTITGEGPINFNMRNNYVNLFCYGTAEMNTKKSDEISMRSIFGFNFPIDDKVMATMQQLISEDLSLSPSNPDNDIVRRAMDYYMGAEAGEENYSTYVSTGFYEKLPSKFESTLLFEGINWEYTPELGYHYNGMAGLAAIGKKQVHLNVRVKAQITKRGNAQYLNLYVQAAPDHWYFFSYEFNGQSLTIYGSNGEWIDMIKALPADKRVITDKADYGTYRYKVGSSRTEVQNFLMRMDGKKPGADEDDED